MFVDPEAMKDSNGISRIETKNTESIKRNFIHFIPML